MKKRTLVLTLVSAGMMLLVSALYAADAPDTVEMNSTVYETHRKPIIDFTHKKHAEDYDIACKDCHHVYKDGKNVWEKGEPVQKCGECHSKDKPSPDERRSMSDAEKMKNFHYEAIHENCQGCHKKLKKDGKATGPISCSQCHVK